MSQKNLPHAMSPTLLDVQHHDSPLRLPTCLEETTPTSHMRDPFAAPLCGSEAPALNEPWQQVDAR
ncbi:hypothetical protein M758_5G193200 [Ceratodon purpureus]|nr:hypothetical protein M758_5G193200 [Ceratodon purpureus]